jgi:glutathione S-transferase
MKLYFSPGACSLAPHIALYEAGLKFQTEKVDLRKKQFSGGDFYKVNPKGSVPVLELEDGTFLTENAVILQYIADHATQKNLIPKAGTMERYRCLEWLNYVATEMHKGFSPLWNSQLPEDARTFFKDALSKKFDYLTEKLKGHTFLMDDQFTVADCYLATILGWHKTLKIDMAKWPSLLEYVERVRTRPGAISALKAEGLL